MHIDANEGFPFAQSTLVRAALVGATQTIWMLGPDDHVTRQERIWRFLLMEYTERARYMRLVVQKVPPERLEVSADGTTAEEILAAEVEAAGGRRHVFEDALEAGGDLVYRPVPRGDDDQ